MRWSITLSGAAWAAGMPRVASMASAGAGRRKERGACLRLLMKDACGFLLFVMGRTTGKIMRTIRIMIPVELFDKY
jgi:hypothetical protein